jgi:hypothetical protein
VLAHLMPEKKGRLVHACLADSRKSKTLNHYVNGRYSCKMSRPVTVPTNGNKSVDGGTSETATFGECACLTLSW